ncbi:transposase [Geothrix limicola]|nr:transposase [Geothrix limicola]
MSETPSGISASGLAKLPDPDEDERNLVSYKTAWLLLHKIRGVMQQIPGPPTYGRVEVSIENLEVVELNQFGRQGKKAVQVLVVVKERADGSTEWACLRQIRDREPETLQRCLMEALGGVMREEIWSSPGSEFDWLGEAEYRHRTATELGLLSVNRVLGELRVWQVGTHWGEMSEKHLGAYLDEFVFRFNHRCRKSTPKEVFDDLVQRALHGEPKTFQDVVRGEA